MALVVMRDATSPECGNRHSANDPLPGPRVRRVRCGECIRSEQDQKVSRAITAAYSAAGYAENVVLNAQLEVLRNELFGRARMVEYWNRVKKEIQK